MYSSPYSTSSSFGPSALDMDSAAALAVFRRERGGSEAVDMLIWDDGADKDVLSIDLPSALGRGIGCDFL